MKFGSIYLAGPITGKILNDCDEWRLYIRGKLEPRFTVYSPTRQMQGLPPDVPIPPNDFGSSGMLTHHAVLTRNCLDIRRSDLIFVNLLPAERISIGTMYEIGFAHALNKPILLVDKPNSLHQHCILDATAAFRAETLTQALELVEAVLAP